jgi:hypothetical protein
MKLAIKAIARHRNGVDGAPFYVVLFDDADGCKVGIVFDQEAHCAILDVAKLAAGDIAFGSNSWRGDQFEPHLRTAVKTRLQTSAASSPPRQQEETADPPSAPDIDVHAFLAERKLVASLWGIEDVQEVRPDLTDDQAWQVLQHVDRQKDATIGITWDTLEWAAQGLFGDAPETNEA